METANDSVNHPAHYAGDGVECIDAIEAIGAGVDFCRGNAIKYLWRFGRKGDALEDAKKARWYVDRLIQQLEQADAKVNRLRPRTVCRGCADGCEICGRRNYGREARTKQISINQAKENHGTEKEKTEHLAASSDVR